MRVLCINGDFKNARLRPAFQYVKQLPKELNEYNVREVREVDGRIGYCLVEFCAGFNPKGMEISFDASRFVPLEDINTLEEILEEDCVSISFVADYWD